MGLCYSLDVNTNNNHERKQPKNGHKKPCYIGGYQHYDNYIEI